MNFPNLYIFPALLVCLLSVAYGQAPKAYLYAQKEDKEIKLRWSVKLWEKDLEGFVIMRRIKEKNWEKIHKGVFTPLIDTADSRNIQQQPVYKQAISRQKTAALIISQSFTDLSQSDLLNSFLAMPMSFGIFQSLFAYNFDVSLFTGFGAIDVWKKKPHKKAEYGLFYKYKGKDTETNPVAVAVPYVATSVPLNDISVKKKSPRSLSLTWNYSKSFHDQGLKYFDIYINDLMKNKGDTLLNHSPYVCDENKRDVVQCDYPVEANALSNLRFTLVLKDLFGNQSAKQSFSYTSKKDWSQSTKPPEILEVSPKQGGVEIKWKFDEKANAHIKGFEVVATAEPHRGSFESIHQNIKPVGRATVVKHPYLKNDHLVRVQANFKSGGFRQSKSFKLYFTELRDVLGAPENLKVELGTEKNKPGLSISFSPVKTAKGYIVETDIDSDPGLLHRGAVPHSNKTKYFLPINNETKREFNIKVIPVDHRGEGYAAEARLEVPGLLPKIPDLEGIVTNKLNAYLKWEYQGDTSALKGFQLLLKDSGVVLDEKQLGPDKRNAILPLEPGRESYFCLKAVSKWNLTSLCGIDRMAKPSAKYKDYPAPNGIAAVWVRDTSETLGKVEFELKKWTQSQFPKIGVYVVEENGSAKEVAALWPDMPKDNYRVTGKKGKYYQFYASYIDKDLNEGRGYGIKQYVPFDTLPVVGNIKIENGKNRTALIEWEYPDAPDVIGFRIYQNGKSVADEKTLDGKSRKWTSQTLKEKTYSFQIEPVSKYSYAHSIRSESKSYLNP